MEQTILRIFAVALLTVGTVANQSTNPPAKHDIPIPICPTCGHEPPPPPTSPN